MQILLSNLMTELGRCPLYELHNSSYWDLGGLQSLSSSYSKKEGCFLSYLKRTVVMRCFKNPKNVVKCKIYGCITADNNDDQISEGL